MLEEYEIIDQCGKIMVKAIKEPVTKVEVPTDLFMQLMEMATRLKINAMTRIESKFSKDQMKRINDAINSSMGLVEFVALYREILLELENAGSD